MKPNVFFRLSLILTILTGVSSVKADGLIPISHPEIFGNRADSIAEEYASSVLHYVNEVSGRRRLTTIFPNEQSPFYGVQMNFVNVGRGNLTFGIRDLVRFDGMPVIFGRIYDSSITQSSDFGIGWKMSALEKIEFSGNELVYTDSNNSHYRLERKGNQITAYYPHLTGITGGAFSGNEIQLSFNGLLKVFERSGPNEFRLTEVRRDNGDSVFLEYGQLGLERIVSSGGRFVDIGRDAEGKVTSATDDIGRAVSFNYDSNDRLVETIDLAGGSWRFDYDSNGLLIDVLDSRDVSSLSAEYNSSGLASQVNSQYVTMTFSYNDHVTMASNAEQQAVFRQLPSGLTFSAQDFSGSLSELSFDSEFKLLAFALDGVNMARMEYEGSRISSLDRNTGSGREVSEFTYNSAGQLISVSQAGSTISNYSYDANGNVLSAQNGNRQRLYSYDENGRLIEVSVSEEGNEGEEPKITNVRFQSDEFGRITQFSWTDGEWAELHYGDSDLIESLEINKENVYTDSNYSYDPRGFRSNVSFLPSTRHEPFDIGMEYDEVGNAIQIDRPSSTGEVLSDRYTLGENNQLLSISGGQVSPDRNFEYDYKGQLVRFSAGDRVLDLSYDELGRLSDVYMDDIHMLTSDYGPMDLDPVHEADRTRITTIAQPIASHVFGSQEALIYSRQNGSPYGPVRFIPTMARFVVTSNIVPAPDEVLIQSLERRMLLADSAGPNPHPMKGFDKASNSLFVPPELYSANCFSCFKSVTNLSLARIGPSTRYTGDTVIFIADASSSECWWSWYDEDEGEWWDETGRFRHYMDFDDNESFTHVYSGAYGWFNHEYRVIAYEFQNAGSKDIVDIVKCDCDTAGTVFVSFAYSSVEIDDSQSCTHNGTPTSGSLSNGSSLVDSGVGYYHFLGSDPVNTDDWGCLGWSLSKVMTAGAWWSSQYSSPRMGVGDISLATGGYFAPHSSHQNGLDVDMRYVRNNGTEGPIDFDGSTSSLYDEDMTQELVTQYCAQGATNIFVDSRAGLTGSCVQNASGHHNHFHVRFSDPD